MVAANVESDPARAGAAAIVDSVLWHDVVKHEDAATTPRNHFDEALTRRKNSVRVLTDARDSVLIRGSNRPALQCRFEFG
jgi:hypothetical protein